MTVSRAALPEQTFFADPAIDRLMGVTMALAAEVYLLRSRVHALERAGNFPQGPGMPTAEERAAEQRDAQAFVAHLLEPLLGEQASRGPL